MKQTDLKSKSCISTSKSCNLLFMQTPITLEAICLVMTNVTHTKCVLDYLTKIVMSVLTFKFCQSLFFTPKRGVIAYMFWCRSSREKVTLTLAKDVWDFSSLQRYKRHWRFFSDYFCRYHVIKRQTFRRIYSFCIQQFYKK